MHCTVCTMQIAKWSSHTSFFLYIPFNSHISTTVVWAWNIDATSAAWFYLLINYICGSKFIPAFPCRFLQFHFPNNTHMNKLDLLAFIFLYILFRLKLFLSILTLEMIVLHISCYRIQLFHFQNYCRTHCTKSGYLSCMFNSCNVVVHSVPWTKCMD